MQPIFITGIGTDIGKTIVSAIITEALQADYWKPIQAGFSDGTDNEGVRSLISNSNTIIHAEVYKLKLPASPHFAARLENINIDIEKINAQFNQLSTNSKQIIIEGAGGILVPLNSKEFVIDLIKKLDAKVILVSRNYLGSINHSLLTASICKAKNIDVLGWVFNGDVSNYEDEIVGWSGFPKIASVPNAAKIDKDFITVQARNMKDKLISIL
jgi:dethiobiotin synthetase